MHSAGRRARPACCGFLGGGRGANSTRSGKMTKTVETIREAFDCVAQEHRTIDACIGAALAGEGDLDDALKAMQTNDAARLAAQESLIAMLQGRRA
jgi:hypothetical protein